MINGKNGVFRTNFLKNFPAVRKKKPALKKKRGGGRLLTGRFAGFRQYKQYLFPPRSFHFSLCFTGKRNPQFIKRKSDDGGN